MAASKSTFRSARIETFKLKARPPRSRLLVYVIHGSGDDDGIWIHNWRNAITPRQSRSVTLFGLKYFTSYSLAYLIFNINRMEISQGVASDYNTNRHAESAFTKIAMVGYSNGTKIIAEIGQDIRDNVKNIVMLGQFVLVATFIPCFILKRTAR
jgi:hypothetical protein